MKLRFLRDGGDGQTTDLFGLLAALARDEVMGFPVLRAHQRQPVHAFLVQIAALAMLRAGEATPPEDAANWEALLLALTPEHPNGEAWKLVVDDWSKPALLQPPGMDPALRGSNKGARTPDALDMLLTARNHDLKGARMIGAGDDDWLFALVSLQTQEGQMGAGNYGISRMNGGYGARVGLGLRPPGGRPGAEFRRDLHRLIEIRPRIEETTEARGVLGLVWTEPWDEATSIPFARLDPYYVELCRRVRLVRDDGALRAIVATSAATRIESKALHGMTGDPWAPTLSDGTKSWGVGASGFGYRQMTTLLDAKAIKLPPLAEPVASEGGDGLVLHAAAVARGQGKTEGFHERRVPIPPKAARGLTASPDAFGRVGPVASRRRDAAGTAQRILRHALFMLHQGGPSPEAVRLDDDATGAKIRRWERSFDAWIDAAFFGDDFWDEVVAAGPQEDVRARFGRAWRERLRGLARDVLAEAAEAAPRTQMRRLRARARAFDVFETRMHRFVEPDPDARGRTPASRGTIDAST